MKRAKNSPSEKEQPSDSPDLSNGKKIRRLGFVEAEFQIPDDFDSIGRDEIQHLFDDDRAE